MTGKLIQFKEALERLNEALLVDKSNPLVLDGSIQRFEFCFELCWKAIQEYLFNNEGIEVKSPRQAFQQAYIQDWIKDENIWIQILTDRNLTSHTYDQKLAQSIYSHLPKYYQAFYNLLTHIESLV